MWHPDIRYGHQLQDVSFGKSLEKKVKPAILNKYKLSEARAVSF
ncbi:hypothetical protein NIES4075_19300 [Tolypothrix sp. NIES-4075]|nr:hypothetical protein [Tolypothrix sp. NIES-4075]GAX40962.1 hypothetical protein NIES4075_19300 [Tolypothrix sp. NIES-4075]